MTENEFLLEDRIAKIQSINNQYDLEHNAYLSFSGGKDSTVLHYLLDLALPNNHIPRVFINTGIEYNFIRDFVMEIASKDARFSIIKPTKNIKQTLEEYGYPFKSKEHSLKMERWKAGSRTKSIISYQNGIYENFVGTTRYQCPKILQYQFDESFKLHISNKCCYKLKKEPAHKWMIENNKPITITGMRKEEGGNRVRLTCLTDKSTKFHPLVVVSEEWEDWFINQYNIKLCKLYYPPFNFKRTGCKGCPFSQTLEHDLYILKKLLPSEGEQCERIWKPVYTEYRRIGYRLDVKIFKIKKKIIEILDN